MHQQFVRRIRKDEMWNGTLLPKLRACSLSALLPELASTREKYLESESQMFGYILIGLKSHVRKRMRFLVVHTECLKLHYILYVL